MKRSWIVPALVVLGACVPKQRLLDSQTQTSAQTKRAEAAEAKAAAVQKDFEAFKVSAQQTTEAGQKIQLDLSNQVKSEGDQLKSANDQIANLQKSNKDIQAALDAKKGELSKQVAELIKERDGLKGLLLEKDKLANAQAAAAASALADKDKSLAEKDKLVAEKDKQNSDLQAKLAAAEADKKALEEAKALELDKVKHSYEDLTRGLKSEISAGQVTITQLKGKLTVNMLDKILFDSGQADVKSDGKKVLEKLGTVLKGVADKDIRIEGHTDNKPITAALQSKYPTNWELSTARATAVARYLEDTAKIDGKRLIAAGYGEFRPVATNETLEGRAQNRRIEIILVPKE